MTMIGWSKCANQYQRVQRIKYTKGIGTIAPCHHPFPTAPSPQRVPRAIPLTTSPKHFPQTLITIFVHIIKKLNYFLTFNVVKSLSFFEKTESKPYQLHFIFCVFYWYHVESEYCVNDKLSITSKVGQPKISCGTGSPISVVFEGDEVYFEFTTNGGNSNGGFMLTYKLTNFSTSPQGTWK